MKHMRSYNEPRPTKGRAHVSVFGTNFFFSEKVMTIVPALIIGYSKRLNPRPDRSGVPLNLDKHLIYCPVWLRPWLFLFPPHAVKPKNP